MWWKWLLVCYPHAHMSGSVNPKLQVILILTKRTISEWLLSLLYLNILSCYDKILKDVYHMSM